ncbi:Alanine--tRNA ligase [compost metagenome]
MNEDTLRFDISHFAKVTDEELKAVMSIVNQKIRENIPVVIREMPKDDAIALGAMALFGEKYGDLVRVVTIDPDFSVELCGGTHVGATGMIGSFIITAESAVAAGVRRIEALTGGAAFRYLADKVDQAKSVAELLKSKDPIKSIEKLLEDKAALEKRVEAFENRELSALSKTLSVQAETINGVQFLGQHVDVSNGEALKKVALDMKLYLQNYLVVLTANIGGKPSVAIAIEDGLLNEKGWDAGKLIKQYVAPLIKGGGGGQKGLATAGGQDTTQLPAVIEAIKNIL